MMDRLKIIQQGRRVVDSETKLLSMELEKVKGLLFIKHDLI